MQSKNHYFFIAPFIFLLACGHLNKAQKTYDTGDYSQALMMAKTQIAQDSTNSAAWVLAGDCFEKLTKKDSAISFYENAIALNTTDTETKQKLTALYVQKAAETPKDTRTALNFLNKAEKLTPTSFDVYMNRGKIYTELTNINKARADFLKAQELSPNDPRPNEQISRLDIKEKQAQELYEKGSKAYKQKKWISAQNQLNQAAEINRDNKDFRYMAHMANGQRAYKKGSVSALWDGISELGFATQLKPQEPEPWFLMGLCYEKRTATTLQVPLNHTRK